MSSAEDLLPGIPDDITLNHIATKLPWQAFHMLSSVSRRWQQVIRYRDVYDARVRRQAAETLVIIKHADNVNTTLISLYSMSKKAVYRLPQIPYLERGLSWISQFISFDGKLYVLGKVTAEDWLVNVINVGTDEAWSDKAWKQEMYVFDLAGQRQWQECASIPEPEREYKTTIEWVVEMFGDSYWRGGSAEWFRSAWHRCDRDTNERRVATPLDFVMLGSRLKGSRKFVVGEATYHVDSDGIYVHRNGSSTLLHSKFSCEELGPVSSTTVDPWFILAVNDELLAIVRWIRHEDVTHAYEYCVLQSEGFGTDSRDIMWRKVPLSFYFDGCTSFAMCPIQL